MYNLFNLRGPSNTPLVSTPTWRILKQNLRLNITKIITYYRNNPMAVKSDHLLASVLINIGTPFHQDIYRFYNNVDTITSRTIGACGLTSSAYKGELHDGVFYGPRVKEVVIGYSGSFDPAVAELNWENLCPVKVVCHPVSNMALLLPNGKLNGSEDGLAVITVDIPMLAIQYRAFRMREMELSERTGDSPLGLYHFIHMYVLPNMMFSHLDYLLFNRADALLLGKPMGEAYRKHSFQLNNFTKDVDKVLNTVNVEVKKSNRNMIQMLKAYPTVYSRNFYEFMDFPEMALTNQVYWVLAVARLNVLEFLFELSKVGLRASNGAEMNKMLQIIKRLESNNLLKNTLGGTEIYQDVMTTFDNLKEIAS